MRRRWGRSSLCVLAVIGACTSTADEATPVRLGAGGGCANAVFYATNPTDTIAVFVVVGGKDPSKVTKLDLSFSDPGRSTDDPRGVAVGDVHVVIDRGDQLSSRYCNDLPHGRRTSRQTAAEAVGSVRIRPGGGERTGSRGTLTLTRLVAKDGTTFTPVTITSNHIGAAAG